MLAISIVCLLLISYGENLHGFQSLRKKYSKLDSALFYDYFKKGPEKKELGRLIKNIIFPGIYVEYADTKSAKQTIRIDTNKLPQNINKKPIDPRGKEENYFKDGTYNDGDPNWAPKIVSASTIKTLPSPKKPADFVQPIPKKAVTIKLGSGISVLPNIESYSRPKRPLILYDWEQNGECKKVREALTILDLPMEIRPCPGASAGWSDFMTTLTSGRRTLPFMVDPNPSMYKPSLVGSEEIIGHLFDTYGPGSDKIPSNLKGKGGPSLFGGNSKGQRLRGDARSDLTKLKSLTLFGWEGAPYVKVVRETLHELGLAHTIIPVASGSKNRALLINRAKGVFQVPYLIDPNTGIEMFESAEIVKYLNQVYSVK